MDVLYNELGPFAADWLEGLIKAGRISHGTVDRRSIRDLGPGDVSGSRTTHLFAGIGGWDLALRLAGWPSDRPVWTGSCPCQPFSNAGKRMGTADDRHLWPEMRRLVELGRPPVVLGEQVASKAGRQWLAGVRADLEALGYAVGAADLCAPGVGAPHLRQRLYWVAVAAGQRLHGSQGPAGPLGRPGAQDGGGAGGMEFSDDGRREEQPERDGELEQDAADGAARWPDADGSGLGLGNPEPAGLEGRGPGVRGEPGDGSDRLPSPEAGFWGEHVWLPCADGKARRLKPGLEPLVAGLPGRVGLLRGYGNAIVPPLAAEFVRAVLEVIG